MPRPSYEASALLYDVVWVFGSIPSAGERPMAYLGPLDCLFGLLTQRWASPIIILHPCPVRVSLLTDENTNRISRTGG